MEMHTESCKIVGDHEISLSGGGIANLGYDFIIDRIVGATARYVLLSAKYIGNKEDFTQDCTLKVLERGRLKASAFDEMIRRMDFEVQLSEYYYAKGSDAASGYIVKSYGKEETPAGPVLVMEPLSEMNLAMRMRLPGEQPKVPFGQAIEIVQHLCTGVDKVHRCPIGIVHGNISSPFVYFGKDGKQPKLEGFTTAQILDDVQLPLIPMAPYGCPEQYDSPRREALPACDVFSLALLLIEMLAGENPAGVLQETLFVRPKGLSSLRRLFRMSEPSRQGYAAQLQKLLATADGRPDGAQVEALTRVIDRALSSAPGERYNSASDFQCALAASLGAAPSSDGPEAIPSPPRPVIQFHHTTDAKSSAHEGVTADMIEIPAGEFIYGSSYEMQQQLVEWGYAEGQHQDGEQDQWHPTDDIFPTRRVYLGTYYIDKYPVTNRQYREFLLHIRDEVERRKRLPAGNGDLAHLYRWSESEDDFGPPPEILDHPVVQISWEDAKAYAAWKGKRLPTDFEWEKAARGPANRTDVRIYPWAGSFELNRCNSIEAHVKKLYPDSRFPIPYQDAAMVRRGQKRILEAVCQKALRCTTPVAQYAERGASAYGVVDLVGNVYEWTGTSAIGGYRIIRGGCWLDSCVEVRTTSRWYAEKNERSCLIGFRCAYGSEQRGRR